MPDEVPFLGCGMEQHDVSPQFDFKSKTASLINLLKARDNFAKHYPEEDRHLFWRDKLIIWMATSKNIFSVGFMPTDLTEENILVVKKQDETMPGREEALDDWISMSPARKEELDDWISMPSPERQDGFSDRGSLLETIEDLDDSVYWDLRECLDCFLRDETSQVLRITYAPSAGEQTTQEWIKE